MTVVPLVGKETADTNVSCEAEATEESALPDKQLQCKNVLGKKHLSSQETAERVTSQEINKIIGTAEITVLTEKASPGSSCEAYSPTYKTAQN